MDDADASFHMGFGRESSPSLAHRLEKNGRSSKSAVDMTHRPFWENTVEMDTGIERRFGGVSLHEETGQNANLTAKADLDSPITDEGVAVVSRAIVLSAWPGRLP